jgi:hypothetical protein
MKNGLRLQARRKPRALPVARNTSSLDLQEEQLQVQKAKSYSSSKRKIGRNGS